MNKNLVMFSKKMPRLASGALAAVFLGLLSSTAQAVSITQGNTVGVNVLGTASIYEIFGHKGDPGGEHSGQSSTAAMLVDFSAGSGNIFNFAATGLTNVCCGSSPAIGPDGWIGGLSNVTGLNGLSDAIGNSQIPLLGVFTTDTDPFGGIAPATLVWDANSPTSLAPLLNQVFYIGDGKSGLNNAGGFLLNFVAPDTATRLYLGVADAWAFNGPSGYYGDNTGSYDVTVGLAGRQTAPPASVPEPASVALLGMGLLGLAAARRKSAR